MSRSGHGTKSGPALHPRRGMERARLLAVEDDARPPLDRADHERVPVHQETTPSDPSVFASLSETRGAIGPPGASDRSRVRRDTSLLRIRPACRSTHESSAPSDHEHWRRERVSFERPTAANACSPTSCCPGIAKPPYQTVIWFPGSYALDLKSTEGDLPFSMYFDFIARSGRALVYPVYSDTYERRRSAQPVNRSPGSNEERDRVVRWAKDFGRTVDYLESRGDFDVGRLAYYGYSMGAAGLITDPGCGDRVSRPRFF